MVLCGISMFCTSAGGWTNIMFFATGISWYSYKSFVQVTPDRSWEATTFGLKHCFYNMSGMASDTKFLLWLLLLSCSSLCFASDLDLLCLKTVQQSVIDSKGILKSSWNFDNNTEGFICQFTGVQCWYPNQNMVYRLSLSNLGLGGQFPGGLEHCTNMTNLDLSSNNFAGPIPSDIARQLPYVAYLELSYNKFSGEIPASISDMSFLTVLNLQHNQFSGQIPALFSMLPWLRQLNVADNQLFGPIPLALQKFAASNFAGNQELCGAPLDDCRSKRKRVRIRLSRINDESSIGAAAGFLVGFVMAFYFPHCFLCCRRLHPFAFRICWRDQLILEDHYLGMKINDQIVSSCA